MTVDITERMYSHPPAIRSVDEDADLQRHAHVIASLADELQRSVQEIMPLYEEVLESLSDAKVGDYVPIFVCRRVKGILSGSRISS